MADGSAKSIEEVELGDWVLATDPETGQTVSRKVRATITGEGEKTLVEVTVDIDGEAGDAVETITATDGHPFWVANLKEWVPAGELRRGDWLRTGSGSWVQVQNTDTRTAHQRVHNLTVDDLHTYHVLAEATPVLVHNCNSAALHDVANIVHGLDNNVYFHYTSERGHSGIMADDGGLRLRANSAGKVHVTQSMGALARLSATSSLAVEGMPEKRIMYLYFACREVLSLLRVSTQ
jgi:hypothetical protein